MFFLCFLFSLNPGESISYIKDQGCERSAEGVGASRMASLPPPLTPKRGAEGVGPMVCPICEPTEHDVIDLIGMGKLRKTTSGRDIACLCKSKVTPLGAKSVSFLDLANLHRATSQPDLPPPPAEENIYSTAEGNSDDDMGEDTEEGTYANLTPPSLMQEESRKRKKVSPALDLAPDPNVGAMASMWNVVSGLRLWGETARVNVEKKKKIDLGCFHELASSLTTACAKMEAREAFLMGRLSERAEVREAVVEEVEKAMRKMERLFKEKRDVDQRPTFAEVAKPKVAFPHLRVQTRSRENVVVRRRNGWSS